MQIPNIPGYKIVRTLSEGKRARIFLAEQSSLQRLVALKILHGEASDDVATRNGVIEQGKLAAKLTHPNLLSVFDIGVHEQQHYIATEHVSGGVLRDQLQDQQGNAIALKPERALQIARDLATGLHFLHQNGLLHRDIKPTNVLFREDGTALLSEAGVSRAVSAKTPENEHVAFGAPHYMSPERAQAQPTDARSDIYSLGVVLWEMLTGHLPFDGEDPFQVAIMHINEPIPQLPAPLANLQGIIQQCLAKQVEQRFANAESLVLTLDQALSERGVVRTQMQPVVRVTSGSLPAVPAKPAPAMQATVQVSPIPANPSPVNPSPVNPAANADELAATAQMPLPDINAAKVDARDLSRQETTEVIAQVKGPPPIPDATMLAGKLPPIPALPATASVPPASAPPPTPAATVVANKIPAQAAPPTIPAATVLAGKLPPVSPSAPAASAPPPIPAATVMQRAVPPSAPNTAPQYTQPVPSAANALPQTAVHMAPAKVVTSEKKPALAMLLMIVGLLGLLAAAALFWWYKQGGPKTNTSAPSSNEAPVASAPSPSSPPATNSTPPSSSQTPENNETNQSGGEESASDKANKLLERAQAEELAGNFVVPADGCAAYYYKQVLQFDASNEQALLGLESVQAATLADVEKYINEGQLASAKSMVEAALQQFPDNIEFKTQLQKLAP